MALLLAFILHAEIEWAQLSLLDPHIIAGLFICALTPAVFCAMTIKPGVVGDAAGDPMKETAGPSLNIVIKLMSVVSLSLAPSLVDCIGLI